VTNLQSLFFAFVAIAATFCGVLLAIKGEKEAAFLFVMAGAGILIAAQILFYKLQKKS